MEIIEGLWPRIQRARRKILLSLLVVTGCATIVYLYADPLLTVLSRPLEGMPLVFVRPMEGFLIKLKLALWGGIVLSFPVIVIQGLSLFPLPARVTRTLYGGVTAATVLFALGLLFSFYFIVPTTLAFFLSFSSDSVTPVLSAGTYFSFILWLTLGVGVVFELPLVLIILSLLGIVNSWVLAERRRYAILLIFVVAAVITPSPDWFTMAAVAVPLILLYELSVWLMVMVERLRKKDAALLSGAADRE